MIRKAGRQDLDALVAIENAAFSADRISRRSFRHLLTRAHAETRVYEEQGRLLGYVMVLFHQGTSLARMYSLAVHPDARGRGLGEQLIRAGEAVALEEGCISLRLEVRRDNAAAVALYQRLGYRQFGMKPDYYEDHMAALRFEKRLAPHLKVELAKVPYYRQTLDFTCGPASLMMAMKAIDPEQQLSRHLELRLWRESTTIFMTSGHGGCGPYGLALAAYHMGFDVELYLSEHEVMFIDSVRSEEKKEVMRLVQEDFQAELAELPVPVHEQPLTLDELEETFRTGGIPVVLISSYRIYGEKFPHWVVVTGFDKRYVYVHDPYVDYDKGKVALDSINMPIPRKDFGHMARYGKAAQKAALILRKRVAH
jgi:ribosomal-protein-alanine acetyltransferase